MKMKDDHDFHVAMSVMGWYDDVRVPLTPEERHWRDTHTREQTIKEAMKYAPGGSAEKLKRHRIQRALSIFRQYSYRHQDIGKAFLERAKSCLDEGASLKQVEKASHHNHNTILKRAGEINFKLL